MPDSNRTLGLWGLRASDLHHRTKKARERAFKNIYKDRFPISCMPKTRDVSDSYMYSELGNWNVAARFAEEKVMKPLIKCDIYEDIARFGQSSILEELENLDQIPLDVLKLSGFSRLLNELIKICRNTKFAMKVSGTKEKLNEIEEKLMMIKEKLSSCYEEGYNKIQKNNEVTLKPQIFKLVLERTSKLKSDLNEPLNKNHLIFTDKEEFDPVAFKNRIKQRMVEKG